MNATQWSSPQHRLPVALAAMLASTLALSSVLWLFASSDAAGVGTSAAVVKQQPADPSAERGRSHLATASTSRSRL
jgi:hypothetical protein